MSQAVEPIHPSGLDFLFRLHFSRSVVAFQVLRLTSCLCRDCTNVSTFFSKHGVDTLSPGDLFSHVSGLETSPGEVNLMLRDKGAPKHKSHENDFNWDITGTEAEILSQIRRYQKNAAVKSTAGSEQGEGDDFEASLKYQLNCLTCYITQILSTE